MKNTNNNVDIKESILTFLEQLKTSDEEYVQEESAAEPVTETAEPVAEKPATPPPVQQKSDYVFNEYIMSPKKPQSKTSHITQAIKEEVKADIKEKRTIRPIEKKAESHKSDSNMIIESLKENSRKLEDLSSRVDQTSNCRFKFDIKRDNNGFISSVIVEKVKE